MAQVVVDYVNEVNAAFAQIGKDVDDIDTDITKLNKIITDLDNSPDKVTQADQDMITASRAVLATLVPRVTALNERTAPDAVPEPPTETV